MSDTAIVDVPNPGAEANAGAVQTEKSAGFRNFLKDFKIKVEGRIHRGGSQRQTESPQNVKTETPTPPADEASSRDLLETITSTPQTDSSNKADILKSNSQEKQVELAEVFDDKKLETVKYAAFGIDDNLSPGLAENLNILKTDIGILAEAVEGLDANQINTTNVILNRLTTSSVPQVRETAQNFLANNVDSYDKALSSPQFPILRVTETLQMLSRGLPSQPSEQNQRITEVIMKHLDQSYPVNNTSVLGNF